MLKQLVKTIRDEFSGQAAKSYVAQIVQHHRIQASPGLRAAAHLVRDTLADLGIPAEIISAPAREGVHYWSQMGFQEWDCQAATLHLVSPTESATKLCDYREEKLSLIQRSAATPPVEADLVLLDDGTEPEQYDGLDVSGMLVLTRGDVERVRQLAVERLGALGIVYYGMREFPPVRVSMTLPDARQYTSFWWYGGEKRCFGFVLSPRQGEALRQLIEKRARAGEPPVRVRAKVRSQLYDGEMEIVVGDVPGETEEKVVVVAHLCHPQPSANDNASGAAAALESARTLNELIGSNKLPKPKRSIRFLWLPEMTGTYAYLSARPQELPSMVAGVNLDMVGEDQELCGSTWLVEYPPESLSTFAGDLMVRVRQELASDVENLAGTGSYALYRQASTPFSGGSDHYIFSDPTVGVPMPMLIQWPDRYYHTSEDTLDKVSASMLARVGTATAAYAYFIANAGATEAEWLMQEMAAVAAGRLAERVQSFVTQAAAATDAGELSPLAGRLEAKAAYWSDRQRESFGSLLRLSPDAEDVLREAQEALEADLARQVARGKSYISRRARALGVALPATGQEGSSEDMEAARLVPRRVFPGPVSLRGYAGRLSVERREELHRWQEAHRDLDALPELALYWADGQRSVAEIAHLVDMECDQVDVGYIIEHFRWLAEVGLVEFVPGVGSAAPQSHNLAQE